MRAVSGPQDVAGMTITMQADAARLAGCSLL
jgi:hypothetical protein